MTSESDKSVWDDIVYGTKNDVFEGAVAEAALRAYQHGVRDPEIIQMIKSPVHKARIEEELGRRSPFRKPRLPFTELYLGESDGQKIGIRRPWLMAHLLFVGNTGSGKTTLLRYLLAQLAGRLKGLWAADLYKQDIRHLRPLFADRGVDLVVATPRDLKLNLLQADCDPRTYLPVALDILRRVLDLPSRAMSILRAVCHQLYKEFGVYGGRDDFWPTLFDVYERVRSAQKLNAAAKDAILDRLGSLLCSLTPGVAAHRLAWKPSDLSQFHINFEMREAAEHVKSLLVSQLMFSILYHRIERGRSNAKLDLCIAFEDAQRFFNSSSTASGEIPATDEIAGLIRGMGVSLWGACQSMVGISKGLLPNFATKIMGRLGTADDYHRLGGDMGMSAKQLDWARTNLRPGTFVAQVAEGPWREPFVVQVPQLNLRRKVSDAEAARSVRVLDSLPWAPATEFANWEPNHVLLVGGQAEPVTMPSAEQASVPEAAYPSLLSDPERRFLRAVVDHPAKPSSAYAKLSGLGSTRAIRVRRDLVEKGMLREHFVATGSRGRNAIILELTETGLSALSAQSPEGGVA